MGRVPITVMGFRCERCGHEWIPRNAREEPKVCPFCKSPYWNTPRKNAGSYEAFCKAVQNVLGKSETPLTWTEIRTTASLSQAVPNNEWVRRMETDIGLKRQRDAHGIIHWQLGPNTVLFGANAKTAKAPHTKGKRTRRKQGAVE